MLREVKNGGFQRKLTLIGYRHSLVAGTKTVSRTWSTSRHRAMLAAQACAPVPVVSAGGRTYWMFEQRIWWDDDGLEADDVLALIRQRERRKQRQLASAHAALVRDEDPSPRREPIPRELRLAVWSRDGGACVECGSSFELQYDHIILVSRGGATTLQNLQILCGDCNRAKSDHI